MDGLACEYQLVDLSSEGPQGGYRSRKGPYLSKLSCLLGCCRAGPSCATRSASVPTSRPPFPPPRPPPTPRGLFPRPPFTRYAAPAPTEPPAAAHPPGRAPFPAATLTRASTAAAALRVALRRRPRAGAGGRSIHRPAAADGIKLPPFLPARARGIVGEQPSGKGVAAAAAAPAAARPAPFRGRAAWPPAPPLPPHPAMADQYIIGERIGVGSFGQVFKGVEVATGRAVALKTVDLENADDEIEVRWGQCWKLGG